MIPVGPKEQHTRWLGEALQSLREQTWAPDEVLIIDDGAGLVDGSGERWKLDTIMAEVHEVPDSGMRVFSQLDDVKHGTRLITAEDWPFPIRVWCTPWVAGGLHCTNFGVGLARSPLVITLGSDDRLLPWAVADGIAAWERIQDPLGYYWMDVEYSDGKHQSTPSGPSMVTKTLWEHSGGYPIVGTVGGGDNMFTSGLHASDYKAGHLYRLKTDAPPYWFRLHPEQDQATVNVRYGSVWGTVRDIWCEQMKERWGTA